jgi:diaminohydroxyphosphoribosylaminopyrimidine deaminase/5-amino-6-(5-phosphoribosylamino)uracil reductase
MGVKVFYVASKGRDGLDIKKVLKKLVDCGIANILIEGGGMVAASAIKAGLVDRVSYFIAPLFLGAGSVPAVGLLNIKTPLSAPRLANIKVRRLGDDILVEGELTGL